MALKNVLFLQNKKLLIARLHSIRVYYNPPIISDVTKEID